MPLETAAADELCKALSTASNAARTFTLSLIHIWWQDGFAQLAAIRFELLFPCVNLESRLQIQSEGIEMHFFSSIMEIIYRQIDTWE